MINAIDGSLATRAREVLAGGASSPVRAGKRVGGQPFFQQRGQGALAFDDQGRGYIDYLMGYGPLLFGYRTIGREQILEALAHGSLFGSTHQSEILLAERIRRHLPSLERIRFATTGTEAVMGMVRVARAFTGRTRVVRFSGNYHGHSDFTLLEAGASAETSDARRAGIPAQTADDVRVVAYNDLPALTALFAREGHTLAAILLEPIVGNMGLVEAEPGFLKGVARLAAQHGALLAFDEVITWLRFGLSGAQGLLGISPDLTSFGKILGGGLPIAGFGGRAEVMACLAPDGAVFTGGTHAGNPLSVAAAHAVLNELETRPGLYEQMASLAQRLAAGLQRVFAELELPYSVITRASVVDFKFRAGPCVRNYREACEADSELFALYYRAMRERGVLLAPSQNEVMFLSTEHTTAQVDETIAAASDALRAIQ